MPVGAISADLLARDPLSHRTHEALNVIPSLSPWGGTKDIYLYPHLQLVRRLLGVAPRTPTPDVGEDQGL